MRGLIDAIKGQSIPPPEEKEAEKPLSEVSLVEKITDHMSEVSTSRVLRRGIHPSEIAKEDPFCPRWHIFRDKIVDCQQEGFPLPFGLSEKASESPNPGLMRIFQMGHSVHSMYQNDILGPAGVLYGKWTRWLDDDCSIKVWTQEVSGFRPKGDGWLYEEPKIRSRGVTGQCDGIVQVDGRWFVLEIKSSNDQASRFRKKPKNDHVRQAQIYANLGFVDFPEITVDGIIFLYVNKNTSEEREFIIPKDDEIIKDVLDGLDLYEEHVQNKSLPKRQCLRPKCKRANACPVKETCFSLGHGKTAFLELSGI